MIFLIENVIFLSKGSNVMNRSLVWFFIIWSKFDYLKVHTFLGKILFIGVYFHLNLGKKYVFGFCGGILILYRRLFLRDNKVYCMYVSIVTSFGVNDYRTVEHIMVLTFLSVELVFQPSLIYDLSHRKCNFHLKRFKFYEQVLSMVLHYLK